MIYVPNTTLLRLDVLLVLVWKKFLSILIVECGWKGEFLIVMQIYD